MKIRIKRRRFELQAGPGVEITQADANAIIAVDPDSVPAGPEGAPVSVVGTDGKLNLVPKHSTWSSPTAYPTDLRAVAGGATNRMGDVGIVSTGAGLDFQHDPVTGFSEWAAGARRVRIENFAAGGYDFEIVSGGVILTHASSGYSVTITAGAHVIIDNGTNNLTIDPALITENMGIVEDDCCDSGSPAKRLLIASAPYPP